MSIIPSILSQACCCATPEPSDVEGRIMSKFGLITECNVGIKPVANDVLACVMQAGSWSQLTICPPYGQAGTSAESRDPIVVPYTLSSSEALSGPDHRPAHHIWWTKNRCLEYDLYYPGANACCCSGGEETYSLFFAPEPLPFGDTLQRCGEEDAGGACPDGTFAADANACYVVGIQDPQPLVGCFEQLFESNGSSRLFWWSYNPYYPVATVQEQYEAHGTAGQVCNTYRQNRSNQGLSTYQVRTAKYRQPDIWEILNFNDGRGIAVMRNNPSAVAKRGRVSHFERCDVYSADNQLITPPYYIVSPEQWDARGAHGLFRYCCAWVSEEFSYVKGDSPNIPFLRENNAAQDVILGRALPAYFHQIADAVPVFSFATDFIDCPGASIEGETSLTKALMETGVEYTAQQTASAGSVVPDTEGWIRQCLAVDDAMRTSEMTDMLACKDWRGEILADIVTCTNFAANYDLAWTAMISIGATYLTADDLKPVGPVRLRGDWFDLRDISEFTGLVDLSKRPPSLARCQSDATSVGDEYIDSVSGQKTLQVDSAIYNVVTAPSGFYQTASAATGIVVNNQYRIVFVGTTDYTTCGASSNAVGTVFVATAVPTGTGTVQLFDEAAFFAWQRLTQSVYFRTKPAGWDFQARFQDGDAAALYCTFAWLTDRRSALYSTDVLAGTAIASIGDLQAPTELQPQWCTNGLPQTATTSTASGPCLTVNCDDFGATVAYEWNSSIFVARHTKSHFYNGEAEPVCWGYDTPLATSNGCCKVTRYGNGSSDPACPYNDSNICFARFVNRPYQWYDGAAPFRMEPTSSNVVDRNPICCEYPHVLQRVCDVNSSETRTRRGGTWGSVEPDPAGNPPCREDECQDGGPPGQVPCNDGSLCPQAALAGSTGYGVGNVHCGGSSAYVAKAPDAPVAFKPGYHYVYNPFSGVNEWVPQASCAEMFKDNGTSTSPDAANGVRRYPVGHEAGTRGTPFIMQSYPVSSPLQTSECCSIDDRSDQFMGTSIQRYHWLSFPAFEIVTY